jgi:methyl-accepting chemotaxis protein
MVEEKMVLSELETMRNLMFLFVGIFMVFGIIAALAITRSIVKPIRTVMAAAKALATMQFDFDIPLDRKDEIGDVQRAFHTIRDELKKTVTGINNAHLGQKNISGNLHISIRESSDGLEVIVHNMDSVQNKTDAQMEREFEKMRKTPIPGNFRMCYFLIL